MHREESQKSQRILVVDDDEISCEAIVLGLRRSGLEADSAPDGDSALALLGENHYDLVLLDLMMPGVTGFQLARKIRESFPAIKTVLMSAFKVSATQLKRADTGVSGFLMKPCDIGDIQKFLD